MDFGIIAGDTDQTIYVRLRDSTTGLAKTGLAFNSVGAVCSYTLPGAARAAITLVTQTVTGAHSDGGFVEVDATNCKGLYRLDLPDAAIASGKYSIVSIEFDGIIEESVHVPLTLRKADVRQWLGTAAATPTVAGVPEVDVTHLLGTAWLTPGTAGTPDVNAKLAGGTAWNSGAIGAATLASDTIAAAKIAANAFTAAKFATDCFVAANFAADVTTEFQSGLATAAALDTVDNLLDTEVAAIFDRIGAPVGASIAADLIVIDNFVDDLESRLTSARAGYLDNINNANLANVPAFPSNFADLSISVTTGLVNITQTAADKAWGTATRVLTAGTNIVLAKGAGVTGFNDLDAAGIRTAVGLASANLDTQLSTIDDLLDTEVAAIQTTLGALFTTALTESYRAAGAAPTPAQAWCETLAHIGDFAISGTTKTLRKINATTAKTFTLDSASAPTSITEST